MLEQHLPNPQQAVQNPDIKLPSEATAVPAAPVSPKEEEKNAPKRKINTFGKAMQIKGLNKTRLKDASHSREKQVVEDDENLSNKPEDTFSQEKLEEVWNSFAVEAQKKGKQLLFNVLQQCHPEVKNNVEIHFTIGHYSAEVEFNNEKHLLLSVLKEKLNNYHIQLFYKIEEIKEENRLYTNEDKFQFLKKKYPILDDLKKKFNLEVDF